MVEFLQKLFDLSKYRNKLERQDALFIYGALAVLLVLGTIYLFFLPDTATIGEVTRVQAALNGDLISAGVVIFFYGFFVATFVATRQGYLIYGGAGIPTLYFVLALLPVLFTSRNVIEPVHSLSLGIIIVLSGVTLRERGLLVGTTVAMVTLMTNFDPQLVEELPIMVIQLAGISIFVYMFIRYAQINRLEGAEKATEARLKLAEITTQIASLTLKRTKLSDVLKNGLDLIQQGYTEFYHVQVFLLDDSGRTARLVSSTGTAGQALIEKRHSIGVGSQSVIGQATLRNIHMISYTTQSDSVHQRNELLPDTLVEVAFPLRVGDEVIGALDFQSKSNLTMDEQDTLSYQSLANSFALAIDNVRQFEKAEARVQENQQLAEQAQEALQEVDRLNKHLMEQAWAEYLSSHPDTVGTSIDLETNTVEEATTWTNTLAQAMADNSLVQSSDDNQRVIAVPLKIRGQVIGAMEFELGEDGTLDPNDLNLIQEVSERFGLAAENTRLIEESQRVAQREALINEIGSRLQATNNIESTLTEAVRSLSEVLGANRVSIKLAEPDNYT